MLIKPFVTPSGKTLFKLRAGQLLLGMSMLVVIGILIVPSLLAFQDQTSARDSVLAEESDASALIFVQREAFGLVIKIEDYLLGQSPRDEILIARSTLAQRLNVITSSGKSSFSIAGEKFRLALTNLDELIAADRELVASKELRAATDKFLTETRLLTDVFQSVSRTTAQKSIEERATILLWQGGLSILALTLGFLLFVWVVRDLVVGFRVASKELDEQRASIDKAEHDFLSIRMLDEKIAHWNLRVEAGEDLTEIAAEVKADLDKMSPNTEVVVRSNGEFKVDLGDGFDVQETKTRRLLEARLRELMSQIQKQHQSRTQLEWERNHDGLTKLLNRRGIGRELVGLTQSASYRPFILFDIDLDGFTGLNNSMGQEAGDRLLLEVATRLDALRFPEISVGRIAADEFGLVVPYGNSNAEEIIERVEKAVRYESAIFGEPVQVSSCIGFHRVQAGESADDAAAKTGAALKAAKALGKPDVTMGFLEADHAHLLTDYLEQISFRNALLGGAVVPYVQPIVDLTTRKLVGYEALARWITPDRGVLTPDRFIPIATQGGLLDELFEVILESVAKRWGRFSEDKGEIYVSINVDPKTLQVTDFAERVQREIGRFNLDPSCLVLEITEQSVFDSSRVSQLENLRNLGVRIALDDFGTGYSSLSQLSSLPIDILKVDRSFIVNGVSGPPGDMLRTIRQMASSANLKVVVEGIETEELANSLAEFGFESGQGYLFGKPEELLAE